MNTLKRKLTAILSADVAGYSKLIVAVQRKVDRYKGWKGDGFRL